MPWANDGGGIEIATTMTLLNFPLASRGPLQEYRRKLDIEVSGSLAGLYWGDSLGRVGVRTWARSPPRELINAIAFVLRADALATTTEVRVWGYTPAFTLPHGAYTNVHRARVFGPQYAAAITVRLCVPLTSTVLERPVLNLVR